MANDILQFVDSVSAAAALRLDLNDGTKWEAEYDGFDFTPPPLRRAINGTLLVDGSVVSASSYDNRVLKLTLSLIDSTVDNVNTQIQLLSRELDRDGNYLKWQPNTATSPVFFRTLRSSYTRVTEIPGAGTFKTFDVELLAEPFAVGLREDIAVGTITNNPATNMFFDVSGVKGDVATPVVIKDQNGLRGLTMIGCRQHGTPSDLVFFGQCESMGLGTDTTNPGGGPDAAMSGTGTNNFVRTSFATGALSKRLTWTPAATTAQQLALRGTYRVFGVVRRSANTGPIQIQARLGASSVDPVVTGSLITVPTTTTARQIIDLGLFSINSAITTPGKYGLDAPTSVNWQFTFWASRSSGTDTLDWDYVLLMPADEQLLLADSAQLGDRPACDQIIDSYNELVYTDDSAGSAIFGGAAGVLDAAVRVAGGFPTVRPSQVNRLIYVFGSSPSANPVTPAVLHDRTLAGNLTVSYWPRYLYIRPATT